MTHHDDHFVPERTTMQGTLGASVEHGHEEVDVNVRGMLQATAWLAVVVAVCIVLALGFFQFLKGWQERKDVVASPLMRTSRVPPQPRLLPNPVDSPNARQGPQEFLADHLAKENVTLDKLGLRDPTTGAMKLPEALVGQVFPNIPPSVVAPASQGPAIDGLTSPQPSDASGGTRLENRLR
jgi:hypothetical protein